MRIVALMCLLWPALILQGVAQPALLRLTVQAGDVGYTDYPVSVDVGDEVAGAADGARLVAVVAGERTEVPFQVVSTTAGSRIRESFVCWQLHPCEHGVQ